jgi:autotransporter-associated beta strand protein
MKIVKISAVVKQFAVGLAACAALLAGSARADTTISSGSTFTIDNSNTTLSGTTRTWNDTGTLTMFNGATLQSWPSQTNTVDNNDALVFKGTGGTIAFKFNGNDSDFMMNGASITSTATGAQTLALHTGNNGNGDRESVTFNSGIPNVGDGSALSLSVTFKTQTGSQSWVNLPAVNTFTGPISLVQGSGGPPTGYLTIGGKLTRYNGNTSGSGTLGGGNYPGTIALGTSTILNYASSAPQTLAGVISGVGALQVTGSGTLTLSGGNTYTGNTTISSGGTLILGTGGGLKFVVTDASNNKITGGGTATLNGSFTIDTAAVTAISGSWTLVDVTTKSFGTSFGLAGFSVPVGNVFSKTVGAQTWTFNKSTGVLSLSSAAIITSFGIPGSAGVINQVAKTIALTVPYGTPLATLAPTFTLTSGSCNQTSGSPPSPTFAAGNTVVYKVTDASVVSDYAVTVSVTPASSNKDILTFGLPGIAGIISGTNIALTVPVSPGVSNLAPTYTLSPFATAAPLSGTSLDFTSPQTYTVTAQDGSTKSYRVTVQTYQAWRHSASLYILTDAAGANLPAAASVTNFPLLVRLNAANFTFSQAAPDGRDIRFSTAAGASLPYQIEQWDSANSTAAVWVKIPTISGNARQEIKMYWDKSDAVSESSGSAVFNAANGYVSVFHLNETVVDAVGTLTPTDTGTTLAIGIIGKGRSFIAGKGVNCGDGLTTLPSGNTTHSTQVWFRSNSSNFDIVDWSREDSGNKVQVRLLTPPKIYIDGNGASVTGTSTLPTAQWHQVVHTYSPGVSRIYIDGQLDASANVTMTMTPPSIMRLGGWYNTYSFVGDMDEVRLSKVTRSADWIKLEYENQKAQQTLVGNPVQDGSALSVAPTSVTLNEGSSATLSAEAGAAQKVYWIEKKNGVDTVLATDAFSYNLSAGRVTGDQSYVIQLRAIYPTEVKTIDVPVTVTEYLPDPVFTLTGPAIWDGRQTITIAPDISNLGTLQAKGAATMTYNWNVAGVAVARQITAGTPTVPGFLTLTRSQGSGPMTVTLVLNNGGALVTATKTITVVEPASDAWVQRTPGATEKPVTKQFFARDPNTGDGMVYYNGTGAGSTPVFLKVYAKPAAGAEALYGEVHRQTPVGGAYGFAVPIAAGKVTYRVEFGTRSGGNDTVSNTVTDLVCGDAYIIEGQSNALATDNATPSDSTTDPWIRTYGKSGGGWGYAVNKGSEMELGLWGLILAKRLSTSYNMPVCIINGAVGGTRIDQHRPNPAGHSLAGSLYSIYANLYSRIVAANLTHGIRGVLWHQGEQDQGSGGPDGDYDYKFYQQYFVDISAAWKQDFPNIRNYYVFQIWPAACGDTSRNDQLREVQRTLPYLYSNMRVMTTLGIVPGSGCHYVLEGYQKFSDLIGPLVEVDHYGRILGASEVITAPDLKKAYYTTTARNEITLEFGQNMAPWIDATKGLFFLDGASGKVSSGSVSGKVIKLTLTASASAKTITYLQGIGWNGVQGNLLYGSNGIAALTFSEVPLTPPAPTGLVATAGTSQVALTWSTAAGATGYNIKRATASGGPYAVIGTTAGATSYTDATATDGATYYYVVSTTNTVGESLNSAEASASPVAPLSSAKDMLTFDFPGLPATTILGTDITVTVPYGTIVTALAPTYAVSPLATADPASGTARDFSTTQSYIVTAQDLTTKTYAVAVTVALSPYADWASNSEQGLTAGVNDGPLADPDRDGISNLLEFTLGGAPMAGSRTILPALTYIGGAWLFEYERSDLSLAPASLQEVEYGSDLTGWTALTIPATSAEPVTITPGSPTDHVKVTLPDLGAGGFVRLKVTQP